MSPPAKANTIRIPPPWPLANADRLLGGEGTIGYDAHGNPIFVPKPGLIERLFQGMLGQVLGVLLPIVAAAAAVWLGIKLWFVYRRGKLEHQEAASRVGKDAVPNGVKNG